MNDLETLLDRIGELPSGQVWEVLEAVMERYRILFPEYELLLMSVPKEDTPERRRQLKALRDRLDEESEKYEKCEKYN